jgi:hypothetical protein
MSKSANKAKSTIAAKTKKSVAIKTSRSPIKNAAQATTTTKNRNRFVVIGMDLVKKPGQRDGEGNQGGGDPGKQGLSGTPASLFQGGVAVIKGGKFAAEFGAIEFPSAGAAFAWIYSPAGLTFCDAYKRVFIQATFA